MGKCASLLSPANRMHLWFSTRRFCCILRKIFCPLINGFWHRRLPNEFAHCVMSYVIIFTHELKHFWAFSTQWSITLPPSLESAQNISDANNVWTMKKRAAIWNSLELSLHYCIYKCHLAHSFLDNTRTIEIPNNSIWLGNPKANYIECIQVESNKLIDEELAHSII